MKRLLVSSVPYLVLLLALALRMIDPAPLEHARLQSFDAYQRLAPRIFDPDLPVRIIDIDDESIARLGQWPWPRTLLAKIVDRLTAAGVSVIAFDMVFAEPDRSSPEIALTHWPDTPIVRALREQARRLLPYDRLFGASIAGSRVVTGFFLVNSESDRQPRVRGTFASAGDDPAPFLPAYEGSVVNLVDLQEAALGNGALNWLPDRDQIVRRVPLVFRIGEQLYPSLAAEALRVAQDAGTYIIKSSGASGETAFGARTGLNNVRIGQFEVPTNPNGQVIVRFTKSTRERYIPAWQVLEPNFDPERVAGRIVFIGTSAAGLMDIKATPLEPAVPGVEVHAQVVEQIVTGDYLSRPDFFDGIEIVYMVVLGILLILLLPRIGAPWAGALGVVAISSVLAASWFAYNLRGWLVDPVYPTIVVIFVFLFETVIVYLRSETERRQVRGAFSRYMSPALVEQLADHPERLTLGGEMRDMTLLFCDIRGFTTISEQFDAGGLTKFINRFLTPMTNIILETRGTIDKYMGDCIMAFWNAPLDDPDHADHACRAALTMVTKLEELNRDWRAAAEAEGGAHIPVKVGVGLNTGMCCVGNMGSDQRFDYSVLGDDVNLASRLEGETKSYRVDIILGENTEKLVPHLAALELDTVQVKGKTRPVRIFALLGDEKMAATPEFAELISRNRERLAARPGDESARQAIDACRGLAGGRLDDFYDYCEARLGAD